MKSRKTIRFISICCALALFVQGLCFAASAAVASMRIQSVATASVAYGSVDINSYKGSYDSHTGFIHSLEFQPGAALMPTLVNSGSNIAKNTLTSHLNQYKTSGQVIGGINGGFFNSYGNAEGLQIQNGKLLSTNDYQKDAGKKGNNWKFYSLGIKADGKSIIDIPHFDLSVECGTVSESIDAFNQLPYSHYGLWMLSGDYGNYAKWDTTYPGNNYYVLDFKQQNGSQTVGGTLTAKLSSYNRFTTAEAKQCKLQKGHIYLIGPQHRIKNLASAAERGDIAVISLAETTGKWNDVQNALRGGDQLIKSGNLVFSPLDNDIKGLYTARTIVATKDDGTMGFFVFDNKSGSYLHGMPLVNAAQTLRNMGYTNAINFDGGGSSTIAARNTPSGAITVRNTPSDGAQRPVANSLALVSYVTPDKLIENFEHSVHAPTRLNGATGSFTLWKNKGAEYSGIACGKLTYDLSAGSSSELRIALNKTDLPQNAAAVSVQANGLSSGISIRAMYETKTGATVFSPSGRLSGDGYRLLRFSIPSAAVRFTGFSLTRGSGKRAGTVYLDNAMLCFSDGSKDEIAPTVTVKTAKNAKAAKGTTLSMKASDNAWGQGIDNASYEIFINNNYKASASSYKLNSSLSTKISKVTYEAADTAGNRMRAYSLLPNASYQPTAYFKDVQAGHWATDYINYCRLNKLVEGDNNRYHGNQNMTRAEFCATLIRMKKVNVSAYSKVKLPYADQNKIPKWALGYVKAAYALGIMQGSAVGKQRYFYPQSNITRAEVCKSIESFLPDLAGFNGGVSFSDQAAFPSWARSAIHHAAAFGIFTGDEKGFRPNSPITRNEIAVVLTRLY